MPIEVLMHKQRFSLYLTSTFRILDPPLSVNLSWLGLISANKVIKRRQHSSSLHSRPDTVPSFTHTTLSKMEVFVTRIDTRVARHEIIRAIAKEVHRSDSDYSSTGIPINFDFRLFVKGKTDSAAAHAGRGTLTFPTLETGNLFLQEFGLGKAKQNSKQERRQISFHGKSLLFQQSRNARSGGGIKDPDPTILERIQTTDYVDPVTAELRERRDAELSAGNIRFSSLTFGWECRDNSLSIEWEHVYQNPYETASLSFSPKDRVLLITVTELPAPIQIALRYNQITTASWQRLDDSKSEGLFLRLDEPATFRQRDQDSWRRLAYLPLQSSTPTRATDRRPHQDISHFLSMTLFLTFQSFRDRFRLLHQAAIANFPIPIEEYYYPIVRRNLFSPKALQNFNAWVNTLQPFHLAYRIQSLVFDQSVDPTEMYALRDLIKLLLETSVRLETREGVKPIDFILRVLEEFGSEAKILFASAESDNTSPLQTDYLLRDCLSNTMKRFAMGPISPLSSREDPGIFMCFHVYITPTGRILNGPLPEMSNTIIRKIPSEHHHRLIRVSFVDEGKLKLQHSPDYTLRGQIAACVDPILQNGLAIVGQRYKFLCYSQSALKQHTAWFFSPYTGSYDGVYADPVAPEALIASMGSFNNNVHDPKLMFCPARYAARISMAFSSTIPTRTKFTDLAVIPDIDSVGSDGVSRVHTDGIGTMSPMLARKVHLEQVAPRRQAEEMNKYSRALQVRLPGSKGMLSVDTRLRGLVVCIRPSMIKFNGSTTKSIDVAKTFTRPGRLYLNRPLVMLLEGLGVHFSVFEKHQNNAVKAAEMASRSLSDAVFFLESNGLGASFRLPSVFHHLSRLGFNTLEMDPDFHKTLLGFAINHVLRVLKYKARIPIPNGWNLPGICDIHDVLQANEIFVCIDYQDGQKPIFIEGPVLVWRSPVIHPGDVQIANGIGKPPVGSAYEQDPLANTVIFNVKDPRPLSTQLGGGDVDGDEYQIIPLNLHPEFQIIPQRPASYPSAERVIQSTECGIPDIAIFFQNYIASDNLGMIASRWLEISDQSRKSIFDEKCLTLSELHSLAVDYPKSGNPVPMKKIPDQPSKLLPDWKAPETMVELDPEIYYESKSAIGRLFRSITLKLSAKETEESTSRFRRRQKLGQVSRIPVEEIASRIVHSFMAKPRAYCDQRTPNTPLVESVRKAVFSCLSGLKVRINAEHFATGTTATFLNYRADLHSICSNCTLHSHRRVPLTEEEAVVGTIVASTTQPRQRLDQIHKLRDHTDALVKKIRGYIQDDQSKECTPADVLCKAFLTWEFGFAVSEKLKEGETFGIASFNIIALGAVFEGVKDMNEMKHMEVRRNGVEGTHTESTVSK